MASSLRGVLVLAALCMLPLSSAQHRQFYRWSSPELEEGDLARRQTPPPGYHPEFGTCGSGTTCENACGGDWLSCKASTDLSLFCYNKVQLNQTCCENGSGRACDNGFYCAWNTFGGKVWCCKNGQSREDCGVDPLPSSSSSIISSSSDGHTTTVTRTTTTTEIRGTDGTYTVTTTEKVGTDGTYTTTKTETVDGGVVTSVTTTTVGAATVTSVTTTTVGTATVITTTTQTVGTATSVVTVTGPAVTQTVSVTVYTSVPPGVSTITAYSTVSVTLTAGCSSTWTKEHGDYPTSKWGGSYPGGPIGHYTDKDGDHYGGGGGDTPHTAGPYDPPKLLVTPSNGTISSPSAVVTSGAGRMTMGGLAAWAVAAMLLL